MVPLIHIRIGNGGGPVDAALRAFDITPAATDWHDADPAPAVLYPILSATLDPEPLLTVLGETVIQVRPGRQPTGLQRARPGVSVLRDIEAWASAQASSPELNEWGEALSNMAAPPPHANRPLLLLTATACRGSGTHVPANCGGRPSATSGVSPPSSRHVGT